jgi:hypothetical protein
MAGRLDWFSASYRARHIHSTHCCGLRSAVCGLRSAGNARRKNGAYYGFSYACGRNVLHSMHSMRRSIYYGSQAAFAHWGD